MVAPDLARAEAAADALLVAGVNLGPLHGIPYGLKDLFDTKGIVTGWGQNPSATGCPRPTPPLCGSCGQRGRFFWARPRSALWPTATSGMAASPAIRGT